MERKKILLLIPNLGHGGAQRVFYRQRTFLSSRHDVVACVFNFDGAFPEDLSSGILSLNIPAGKNLVRKVLLFRRRIAAVKKLKREHGIEIAISHLEGADYVNVLSVGSEKIFCWIHGAKAADRTAGGWMQWVRMQFLLPRMYRKCDLLVTVSEGIKLELQKRFSIPGQRIKRIYNGVDLDDITRRRKEPLTAHIDELFAKRIVLIAHCRLAPQKNLEGLLEIFDCVRTHPGIVLVILGDGELREQLLSKCAALNLSAYHPWGQVPYGSNYDVYFLGYQQNPYPFLSRACLYLMTSSWEGFPLSLCEAMASEVPVLSSDCPTGPFELIAPDYQGPHPPTHGIVTSCGVLMPLAEKSTLDTWRETIDRLLREESERIKLSQGGRSRVDSLDLRHITNQWLEILK